MIQINTNLPMAEGWYILEADNGERCLTYFYKHPELKNYGFGFNVKDGGGFLPLYDLLPTSKVYYSAIEGI